MGRVKELFLVYEFIENYINVSLILFCNKVIYALYQIYVKYNGKLYS